jgi:hypothetical protein
MTNSWAEPPSRPALETALPTLLKQLKLAQFRSQWQAAEQQAQADGWNPASYLYVGLPEKVRGKSSCQRAEPE